jgi:hypothetical protein
MSPVDNAAPDPQGRYVPPPPPRTPWKWILIGCGGLAFIGMLACGGCGYWAYSVGKSTLAIQQEAERIAMASPEIAADIGTVRRVTPTGRTVQNPDQSAGQFYMVQGENGGGELEVSIKLAGFEMKMTRVVYIKKDGTRVELKTGR